MPYCGVCMCKVPRFTFVSLVFTRAFDDKFSCANSDKLLKHYVDCRSHSPHCTQQWDRRGPGCMTVHNETSQNQLPKPRTHLFLMTRRHRLGLEKPPKPSNPFCSDSLSHHMR